jgi:hypothetical protein
LLHDSIQGRIPDVESLADLRSRYAGLGIQTPDLARLILTDPAASATIWPGCAGEQALNPHHRNSFRGLRNTQLVLPLIRHHCPLISFAPQHTRAEGWCCRQLRRVTLCGGRLTGGRSVSTVGTSSSSTGVAKLSRARAAVDAGVRAGGHHVYERAARAHLRFCRPQPHLQRLR